MTTQTPRRTLTVDAIMATIDAPLELVVARLNLALNTIDRPARPLPGRGYPHAFELVNANTLARRCLVMFDSHRKPHVYAEGTEAYDAPATFAAIVKCFPGKWLPSRIDPALDFHGPSRFDELAAILIDIAKRRNVKLDQRGDWTRGAGRTLYVGSRQSPFYVRLYEYRQHHGYGPEVRLELELKPNKTRHRETVASLDPWFMLTTAPVVRELLTRIGTNLKAVPLFEGTKAPQTIDRDMAYIASQAFLPLARLIAHYGTPEAAFHAVSRYRDETADTRSALLAGPVTPCHNPGELLQVDPGT